MLVLARRRGEKITINGNIEVIVNKIVGERVWLAIHAPRHISIVRTELIEAREAQAK